MDIPNDIAAAVLWIIRPSTIFNAGANYFVRPNAIPSKTACVLKAINSTNDVKFKPSQHPFYEFFSSFSTT